MGMGIEGAVLHVSFLVFKLFVACKLHGLHASEGSKDFHNDLENYLHRLKKIGSLPDYIQYISCLFLRYSDVLYGHCGTPADVNHDQTPRIN